MMTCYHELWWSAKVPQQTRAEGDLQQHKAHSLWSHLVVPYCLYHSVLNQISGSLSDAGTAEDLNKVCYKDPP